MFRWILIALPFLALVLEVLLGFISALATDAQAALAVFMMVWMVSWWIFEVVPLGVTALIPMVLMPFLGVVDLKAISVHYSNPVIYLFLGGFILARGLEKTRLNERIALRILKITGKTFCGPKGMPSPPANLNARK